MKKPIYLIGAECGIGAQIIDCQDGPQTLFDAGLVDALQQKSILACLWDKVSLFPKKSSLSQEEKITLIRDFNYRLLDAVYTSLKKGGFPLILGGDHSTANGTWNGVRKYLNQKSEKPMGLLWIDAHMDGHTFDTSPSNAIHGMVLASLLGIGDPRLCELYQKETIEPKYTCLIGTRSYEEGEKKLLEKLGVRIFYQNEIEQRGLESVMTEAISIVSNGTCGFGVSLDMDVFDPQDAPGVGSPEGNGVNTKEMLTALGLLRCNSDLKAFELVEYNPARDINLQTYQLAVDSIVASLGAKEQKLAFV